MSNDKDHKEKYNGIRRNKGSSLSYTDVMTLEKMLKEVKEQVKLIAKGRTFLEEKISSVPFLRHEQNQGIWPI